MKQLGLIVLTLICWLAALPGDAQETHEHQHPEGEVLGHVHFPITCKPEIQPAFDRAMALLHSFGYEAAREAFVALAEQDPACGMSRWGVAMTWYHPIWPPPTPAELAAGRAAAEEAARLGARSEREKGYIAAIGAFYRDADKLDHRTRAAAYQAALEKLAAAFPEDDEAAIFHAAAGWVAFAEGRKEEAVKLLSAGADKEAAVGKHPVTPGSILPARELLGDLLLELGKPREALAAYEASLADAPKRLNGLAGAARAAELAGEKARARSLSEELLALCGPSCEPPEAQRAKAIASGG